MPTDAVTKAYDLLQRGKIAQKDFDEIERFSEFLSNVNGNLDEHTEWLKDALCGPDWGEWLGLSPEQIATNKERLEEQRKVETP